MGDAMREILYKNLINDDKLKQDLCIREVIMRDDFMAKIERRCVYFVRERVYIDDPSNLDKLKGLKDSKDAWKRKHFHILRNHDSESCEDRLLCKVAGTLYAIVGHYVFCIAFVHSFKIDLIPVSHNEKKA